jgi:hypothetical protein
LVATSGDYTTFAFTFLPLLVTWVCTGVVNLVVVVVGGEKLVLLSGVLFAMGGMLVVGVGKLVVVAGVIP